MTQGLISLIIPVYNAERYLAETCESVFAQSYEMLEVILVDDGSTDQSGALCDALCAEHKNVRVIHTENGGVCRARNLGLDAAEGEYVAFLDADDLLLPNALQTLHAALSEHGADIAIGWKSNMTAQGDELGCPYARETALWRGNEALAASLSDHPATYAVWGKLYRKEAIGDTRFFVGKKVHEDSFFLFECLEKEPTVVLTDACVLKYRLSENSASRAPFSEKFFDILFFAERKEEIISQKHPSLSHLLPNLKIKANLALLHNLMKTKDAAYRPAARACIREIKRLKRHFSPALEMDKRFFFLVTHNLYYPYKWFCAARGRLS